MSSPEPATAAEFPPGFFDRVDESPDPVFYGPPRLVTHIDDHAIAAVGEFYARIGTGERVLDLMSSWISHLPVAPRELTVLGMNRAELEANSMADAIVVHDLNDDPTVPFDDASFDTVICTVSVDYLTRPVAVFADVARVLAPGGRLACTFSNRCFPTKAIRGWLETDDRGHCAIVARYIELADAFEPPAVETLVPAGIGHDPLYAVWADRR